MPFSEDVAIFWDYENCSVPTNASGYEIVDKIVTLARPFGCIKQFRAYLEIADLNVASKSATLRSELQSSGVTLVDCPHNGRKEVADKMLLVDMMAHAIDHPSPTTIMIITGDRDFAYALATLKLRGFRLVLVTLPNAHASLKSQATICYDWFNTIVNSANAFTLQDLPINGQMAQLGHKQKPSFDLVTLKCTSPPQGTPDHYKPIKTTLWRDVDIYEYLPKEAVSSPISTPSDTSSSDEESEDLDFDGDLEKSSPLVSLNTALPAVNSVTESTHRTGKFQLKPAQSALPLVSKTFTATHAEEPAFCLNDSLGLALTGVENDILQIGKSRSDCSSFPPQLVEQMNSTEWEKHLMARTMCSKSEFAPLIHLLNAYRQEGRFKVLRSSVGLELTKTKDVYRRAGVAGFKDYVALAEKDGVVELGGKSGYAWIALQPQFCE